MTARPWMPFYFGDYLADTGHLSTIEHGAYLLLIAHYWQRGSLPTEPAQLARIARVTIRQWNGLAPTLCAFFDEGWKHKRIEFELTEAARISAAGRKGGIASGKKRAEKSKFEPNDRSQIVERSANDQPTKREALHLQSQTQEEERKKEPSLRSDSEGAVSRETFSDDWPPDYQERFWSTYPKKAGKLGALKALDRVRKRKLTTWEKLIAAVQGYAATADPQFTKDPQTWLNKGCWDDEPRNSGNGHERTRTARTSSQDTLLAGFAAALGERPESRLYRGHPPGRGEGLHDDPNDRGEPRTIDAGPGDYREAS